MDAWQPVDASLAAGIACRLPAALDVRGVKASLRAALSFVAKSGYRGQHQRNGFVAAVAFPSSAVTDSARIGTLAVPQSLANESLDLRQAVIWGLIVGR